MDGLSFGVVTVFLRDAVGLFFFAEVVRLFPVVGFVVAAFVVVALDTCLPAVGVVIFAPKQYKIEARNTKNPKACNFILLACFLPQKYGCEIRQKSIHKIRRK